MLGRPTRWGAPSGLRFSATSDYGTLTLGYVLLFDVNGYVGRQAAAVVQDNRSSLDLLAFKHAPVQRNRADVQVRVVPSGKPVEGEVCLRVMVAPASGEAAARTDNKQ